MIERRALLRNGLYGAGILLLSKSFAASALAGQLRRFLGGSLARRAPRSRLSGHLWTFHGKPQRSGLTTGSRWGKILLFER